MGITQNPSGFPQSAPSSGVGSTAGAPDAQYGIHAISPEAVMAPRSLRIFIRVPRLAWHICEQRGEEIEERGGTLHLAGGAGRTRP